MKTQETIKQEIKTNSNRVLNYALRNVYNRIEMEGNTPVFNLYKGFKVCYK